MKMKIKIVWITVMIAVVLSGCSTRVFSPGPTGLIGPQGNLVQNEPLGPVSPNIIVIESKGNLVVEEYDLVGFEEIEIGSLMEVVISQGEGFNITTSIEEDAVPYLQVSLEGKRLRIGLDPSQAYQTDEASLLATITLPELSTLIVSGVSHVTLDEIRCVSTLDIVVEGVSSVDGQVSGCDLDIQVSKTSNLQLAGTANQVSVSIETVSKVDISSLDFQYLEYEADGTSELIQ
jgi:hypothetical protein